MASWLGLGGSAEPAAADASWVRLLARDGGDVVLHAEGRSALEAVAGGVALVAALGDGSAAASAGLAPRPPPADGSVLAWLRPEPLKAGAEATVLLVDCGVAVGPALDGAGAKALACVLLGGSVCSYAAPGGVDHARAVEPWAALDGVLRRIAYNAGRDGKDAGEQEGVVGAMPHLVWAFETCAASVGPAKVLEGAVLAAEKGFSEDVAKRNNARLLVTSVFARRDGAARDDGAGWTRRVVDAAAPKLALGHVVTGPMLGVQLDAWCASLKASDKAAVVAGGVAAVAARNDAALGAALAAHAAAVEPGAASPEALEEALAAADEAAVAALFEHTRAAAPPPRGAAAAPPPPPTAALKAELRARAAAARAANGKDAAAACAARADAALEALAKLADAAVDGAAGDDGDDGATPLSRRAELWLQSYRGRFAAVVGDYREASGAGPGATDVLGDRVAAALPLAVARRSAACLDALEAERTALLESIARNAKTVGDCEAMLDDAMARSAAGIREYHEGLASTMAALETEKMERESELADASMEIDAVTRAADRVDGRLRLKLEGAVARSSARLDDARQLVGRYAAEARDAVGRSAGVRARLGDARLDTLRVRCVTLGHEKANLSEHMELLEEHLERLKADLDHKHAEVNEVEHQWSQTKAKLPSLKAKFVDSDKKRGLLTDLARRLKAHIKDSAKGGALPRLLLQHLDPMERQALEDL